VFDNDVVELIDEDNEIINYRDYEKVITDKQKITQISLLLQRKLGLP
jgi:hypothetical protein